MFNTRCLFSEGSHNNNMRGIMSPSLCKVSPSSHQYTHTWTRRHHLFTHIYVYALRRVVDGWWSYIHEKEVRAIGVGFVNTRERHGAIWGAKDIICIYARTATTASTFLDHQKAATARSCRFSRLTIAKHELYVYIKRRTQCQCGGIRWYARARLCGASAMVARTLLE